MDISTVAEVAHILIPFIQFNLTCFVAFDAVMTQQTMQMSCCAHVLCVYGEDKSIGNF